VLLTEKIVYNYGYYGKPLIREEKKEEINPPMT
jgi:hypothetical protein